MSEVPQFQEAFLLELFGYGLVLVQCKKASSLNYSLYNLYYKEEMKRLHLLLFPPGRCIPGLGDAEAHFKGLCCMCQVALSRLYSLFFSYRSTYVPFSTQTRQY